MVERQLQEKKTRSCEPQSSSREKLDDGWPESEGKMFIDMKF